MGKLILITLPIGNHLDLGQRAISLIKAGEYFAVEDTRKFRDLLIRLNIDSHNMKISSFHDHSSNLKIDHFISILSSHDLYLCSDAGSPVISDPAFPLITSAIENGYEIATIPGCTSVIGALEVSGLPAHPFTFHGFLSREKGKIAELKHLLWNGTHIYFESPHRICESLKILTSCFPNSEFAVVKEITKTFEDVKRFKGLEFNNELMDWRGEFVLLFNIQDSKLSSKSKLVELSENIISKGMKPKLVAKLLGEILEQNAGDLYSQLIESKK